MAVTQDANAETSHMTHADPEISPRGLQQFYLRTLARAWARTPRRIKALEAMLSGARPVDAARVSGLKRQTCSQILRTFHTFAANEGRQMARRRAALVNEDEDLTQMQVLERLLGLETQ